MMNYLNYLTSVIIAMVVSYAPVIDQPTVEALPKDYVSISTEGSSNDFEELLSNHGVGTIVSLDIPWDSGDVVEAYAEGPLEYAFTDYNGNDVYYNDAGEQVFSDRSTAADSAPYVAPQPTPTPSNNGGSTSGGASSSNNSSSNNGSGSTWDGVASRFYPTYNCDIDCARQGSDSDYLIDIHNEMWMDSGPFQMILGHNYLGMGSKVHKLVQGDIVEIYGSPMNGRWRVIGITWTPKYGAFYEDVPKYSNYALQTCETDDRIRFVFLERA